MRPGRPPLDATDRSFGVYVKLPGREFDEVQARAQREQISMAEVLRRALRSQEGDENESE